MRREGELLKCDRCGMTEFIEKNDKRKPEGWNGCRWCPPGWKDEYARHLCPECARKYEAMVAEFMRNGKIGKEQKA